MEQTLEWNLGLYLILQSLKRPSSVDRKVLWKILRHYGIPAGENREDDLVIEDLVPCKH